MSADATIWATRLLLGELSPVEQAQLDAWLAADLRREGALIRAEAALALVARARSMKPIEQPPMQHSRRHLLGWGVGAAIAASVAGLWSVAGRESLSTQVGEIRKDRLADASVVTLNTQSRVTIALAPRERRVDLDRGEAWFQVAHDRTRPFIVSAGDLRVRAVGTAFSVRKLAAGADVLVTEGRVEVWRADQPGRRVAISSGRRAFASTDGLPIIPVKAPAGIQRALAWRSGRLALAGESLDYAVAEMNRYNEVQLKVADPELGRRPIIGRFDVEDPIGFARSVALLEGATVQSADGGILIAPAGS